MKAVGIKDEQGNNVTFVNHKNPLPKDFWSDYKPISCSWVTGSSMAKMVVKKLES